VLLPVFFTCTQTLNVCSLVFWAFQVWVGVGLARFDFFYDGAADIVYLSEVKTMPGFTPMSMYAKMWQASGVSYPAVVDRLVELALARGVRGQES